MNYLAIRNEVIGTRFDSSQDANVKNWVASAYSKVWNAADWEFKHVQAASLAVVAGNDSPTMPTAFNQPSSRDSLLDDNGTPLYHMMPQDFERWYRTDKQKSLTGTPEAYTINNGQIILAPTPSSSKTFALTYDRKLCSFLSNGTTVQVGSLSADTDLPLWDDPYHMVLVYGALEIGGGIESDISGVFWSSLYTDALAAMVEGLKAGWTGVSQQDSYDVWGAPATAYLGW